jgi:Tfp pilus assembly protein PilO
VTSRLRPQERALLTAGIGAIVVILLAVLVFYPQVRGVATARLDARRKQAELARLTALAQQRTEIIRRRDAMKQVAGEVLSRIPAEPGLPDLLLHLDAALTSSRVFLLQLTFLTESAPSGGAAGNVASLPVQLRVRGTYPQMRALVRALEEAPRLLVIDRVALTGSDTGIVADLVVRALFVR